MQSTSPQKANNPNTRVGGYFFGSFIMIGRDAYEIIGTHERVREEIVEDVELGRIVKDRRSSIPGGPWRTPHHSYLGSKFKYLVERIKKINDSYVSERKGKSCNDYLCYISHVTNAIDFIIIFDFVVLC